MTSKNPPVSSGLRGLYASGRRTLAGWLAGPREVPNRAAAIMPTRIRPATTTAGERRKMRLDC